MKCSAALVAMSCFAVSATATRSPVYTSSLPDGTAAMLDADDLLHPHIRRFLDHRTISSTLPKVGKAWQTVHARVLTAVSHASKECHSDFMLMAPTIWPVSIWWLILDKCYRAFAAAIDAVRSEYAVKYVDIVPDGIFLNLWADEWPSGIMALERLAGCDVRFRSLTLRNLAFSDIRFNSLVAALARLRIQELVIGGYGFTGGQIAQLVSAASATGWLSSLAVHGAKLNGVLDDAKLVNCLSNDCAVSLAKFTLGSCTVDKANLAKILSQHAPSLRSLTLKNTAVSNFAGSAELMEALHSLALSHLALVEFKDEPARFIAQLPRTLRSLTLKANDLFIESDLDIEELGSIIAEFSYLTTLDLTGNLLRMQSMGKLLSKLLHSSVTELLMDGNAIAHSSILPPFRLALSSLTKLTKLSFRSCSMTADGAALVQCLPPMLSTFDLSYNKLGKDGDDAVSRLINELPSSLRTVIVMENGLQYDRLVRQSDGSWLPVIDQNNKSVP